ncbi:hypothetical protein [Rufibacter sp. LB8]|uniref:hypothetical protein n=1 Tax=Rufibacter sp. LB8 TaxID=2777781 RepID=UPI00178C2773|nr:hypothetical protein [Rufibacter sp. LB8]
MATHEGQLKASFTSSIIAVANQREGSFYIGFFLCGTGPFARAGHRFHKVIGVLASVGDKQNQSVPAYSSFTAKVPQQQITAD